MARWYRRSARGARVARRPAVRAIVPPAVGGALAVLVGCGCVVVLGWSSAERMGSRFPAAPVLLAAGALAGTGRLSLALVLVLAALASLGSDTIWYWIGRTRGGRVLGWLCRIALEPDSCVRRTQSVFSVHGARSLLVAKFVPGFSTAAPPLAGLIRVPLLRFVVFTGLGGLIWAGGFAGVGWLFSRQLEGAAAYVARLGSGAVALAVAGLGGYIALEFVARQRFLTAIRIARSTPEELRTRLDVGPR